MSRLSAPPAGSTRCSASASPSSCCSPASPSTCPSCSSSIPTSSFHYHHARLIDTLHCLEKLEALLRGPDILSPRVRAVAGINAREGVGVAEAPRGTLFHHYRVDDDGLVEWVNLVIATGHNNLAMNRSVLEVARHYVRGDQLTEPMLNRVEAVIRCYDPCLSCATHAVGQMPLKIELLDAHDEVLDAIERN